MAARFKPAAILKFNTVAPQNKAGILGKTLRAFLLFPTISIFHSKH
jgi:hypothetical protein